MVYYEPVEVTTDIASLADMIINIIVQYLGHFNYIVSDKRSLFKYKL